MEKDLEIDELGPQGDGISVSGRARIYVERAIPGDKVRAKIFRDRTGVSRAEVVKVLARSEYRVDAPCEFYERCGNCTLQHLEQSAYRAWKWEVVKQAFRSQRLTPKRWLSPIYVGENSRRRATFSARKQKGKVSLGYYRRRSQELVEIDRCLVSDSRLLALRSAIKPFLPTLLREGESVDIFFQVVGKGVDVVLTKATEPEVSSLKKFVDENAVTKLGWRPSERDPIKTIISKGDLTAHFGELQVSLPQGAFLQATLEGERALVSAVMSGLPVKGNFADLFSGNGTFSGPMLARGKVDAFESSSSAVKALTQAGGNKPLKVFRRDLFKNPLKREELNRYDAVVFDPPRAGAEEQAFALSKAKTGTVIAVSCNPATLARDARILCDGGFWLQSVQVIDQFLWSHHIETVAVFSKKR